jgi:hypothetical protein
MTTIIHNKKCVFCKIDLSARKERPDGESVKYCSSKCRKADMRNSGKLKKSKRK